MRHLRPRKGLPLISLLALGATLVTLSVGGTARAGTPYIETGFGVSELHNSAMFFNAPVAGTSSLGGAFNLGFWWNLSSDFSDLQIHFGIKDRVSTGGSNGLSFVLNAPYPALRMELSHFYFGFGATPLMFRRQGSLFSVTYERVPGSLGLMGELGILWKVVPFFHLALEGGIQYVSLAGLGSSPAPAADLTINLRFFLSDPGGGGGEGGKRKFDGWRYPFGLEIH